jgi:hypothetical protein
MYPCSLAAQQSLLSPPPRAVRLQLLARVARDLAVVDATDQSEHSLLELEGIDAQQYVNDLRDEWDRS